MQWRMRESVLALLTSIKQQRDGRIFKDAWIHSGRNEQVRRAAKNHGRGPECGNVAYRIFHLDKVSFWKSRGSVSRICSKNRRITDLIWGMYTQRSDRWCITRWYQKCKTWPYHHIEFFQWWYGRNAGPKSSVHWLGACANDHALISCTIDEQPRGRTGAIKAKKIDPKQIPRIQSKLDAIMRSITQQIITDVNEG